MSVLKAKKGGRKSPSARSKAIEEATKEDVKRLNVIVPESMYTEFFIKARREGHDMSKLIKQWIQEFLEDE